MIAIGLGAKCALEIGIRGGEMTGVPDGGMIGVRNGEMKSAAADAVMALTP